MAGSRDGAAAAALRDAARGLEFKVRPTGRYRVVSKGERRSLIELVDVDGLEEFRSRLGLGPAPAHVTLFTEPGGSGIALYTAEELENSSSEAELALPESPWRLDEDGAILGA